MEIGSVFPLTTTPAAATNFRCALRAVVKAVSPKRIILPDYYCPSIYGLFPGLQYDVAFRDGQTKCSNIPALDAGDLIIVVNYFGFRNHDFWDTRIPDGVTVVEDMSMSFYLSPMPRSDYTIYNLRKFFPLPDGALIFSRQEMPLDELCQEPPWSWWGTNLQAMMLRKDGAKREDWFAMSQAGKKAIPFGPYKMSDYSTKRLALIHDPDAAYIRRRNYERLMNYWLTPMLSPVKDEAPWGFPIATKRAEQISKAMAAKGVFAPVIWPGNPVLMLPCDHRYGVNDMEQVAAVFKECK